MEAIVVVLIAMVSGAIAGVLSSACMEAYFQRRASDVIYTTEFHEPEEPVDH